MLVKTFSLSKSGFHVTSINPPCINNGIPEFLSHVLKSSPNLSQGLSLSCFKSLNLKK
jgi:hypothetical protein